MTDDPPTQRRIREYRKQPDNQAVLFEFDMNYGVTTDTDTDEMHSDDDPLHMSINPDDFWTFDGDRDEMYDRAELHHPELNEGDLR